MCFVALFQSFEHPHNLVRENIITRRLVAYLLLYYQIFMVIYCIKYRLWIVDLQSQYFLSTVLIYSGYATFIEDISTVLTCR